MVAIASPRSWKCPNCGRVYEAWPVVCVIDRKVYCGACKPK